MHVLVQLQFSRALVLKLKLSMFSLGHLKYNPFLDSLGRDIFSADNNQKRQIPRRETTSTQFVCKSDCIGVSYFRTNAESEHANILTFDAFTSETKIVGFYQFARTAPYNQNRACMCVFVWCREYKTHVIRCFFNVCESAATAEKELY